MQPSHSDVHEAALQLGNYKDEIKAYERAIELMPDLAGAWYNKGIALKQPGRMTESSEDFAMS